MVDNVKHNLENIMVYILNEIDDRDGSEKDVKLLEETFAKFGDCVNVKTTNGSKEYIKQKMTELEKDAEAHKRVDGVILVAMSHSSDTDEILTTFYKPIRKLQALEGKLVLLISQGCRGSSTFTKRDIYGCKMFHIIWLSTAAGDVAIRTHEGSPFIKGVCENLVVGARAGTDIETIVKNSKFDKSICLQPTYVTYFSERATKFYLPQLK